ncbi:hypothetical protein MVEN_02183400 [Mycena venus]|uniref:Uncharacterized protein n=1 Tax=Mycena venus TaxID=2733690 RepID=A0A8H6X9D7_9AGAR|nr:hypothetical protein MVEN_02183400 [Mycena venus]
MLQYSSILGLHLDATSTSLRMLNELEGKFNLAGPCSLFNTQSKSDPTPSTYWPDNGFDLSTDSMDFNLQVLDEYFASSGAGLDPYTTLFPEAEVSGFARDSMGSISETDTGVENRGFEYFQQPLNWSASMVSQELPALSAPQPSPSPSHTEPDEPISVDENDYIAPRDINLNLDERNVLPGNSKRQRTRSSRAADADSVEAVRPAKRGQH